jgi:hypothetical protein
MQIYSWKGRELFPFSFESHENIISIVNIIVCKQECVCRKSFEVTGLAALAPFPEQASFTLHARRNELACLVDSVDLVFTPPHCLPALNNDTYAYRVGGQ